MVVPLQALLEDTIKLYMYMPPYPRSTTCWEMTCVTKSYGEVLFPCDCTWKWSLAGGHYAKGGHGVNPKTTELLS